jgi:hypothetical protein
MRNECEETRDREKLPFLCECGDVGCERCVPMTAAEYLELPNCWPWLALAPGHGLWERSAPWRRDR